MYREILLMSVAEVSTFNHPNILVCTTRIPNCYVYPPNTAFAATCIFLGLQIHYPLGSGDPLPFTWKGWGGGGWGNGRDLSNCGFGSC